MLIQHPKKDIYGFFILPKMSHLTLHLFNRRREGKVKLLPAIEEMDQEHMKMNAIMLNKGGGLKQKDHDMIMNKRNERQKWSYYMITHKSQRT